jgi:hypothetical protein
MTPRGAQQAAVESLALHLGSDYDYGCGCDKNSTKFAACTCAGFWADNRLMYLQLLYRIFDWPANQSTLLRQQTTTSLPLDME